MRALICRQWGGLEQLQVGEAPVPRPGRGEVLIRVHACAVCRTDLHVVDGELTRPKLPLVPGHQIVGVAVAWGLAIVGTLVILKIVDVLVGLRVEPEHEVQGLDLSQHGEEGYNLEA